MSPQILVVSDPLHGEVDHETVAEILVLDVADVRAKLEFPAPEVLASSDAERAAEVATSLRAAGVSVVVIDAHDLVGVPWPTPAHAFDFGPDGLTLSADDGDIHLPYDTAVTAVYCRPPAGFDPPRSDGVDSGRAIGRGDGPAVSEGIEWTAHLDLYFDFAQSGDVHRVALVKDVAEAVSECAVRFHRMKLDTRLENVRPRRRFIGGDTDFDLDLRKAYSFGTLLLRQVLESVSPELRDVTHYEFGSRLGYVVSRTRARQG